MNKQIKYTVSAVIIDDKQPGKILTVKRPDDDADLCGDWGFPSISLQPGESPEDGARRACMEKLGCKAKPARFPGVMFQRRNSYDIFLMDFEMQLLEGEQPDIKKANTTVTKYVDQQWTDNSMLLMPGAQRGSCCASIFLTDRGLLNRSDWIASLEGSNLVA